MVPGFRYRTSAGWLVPPQTICGRKLADAFPRPFTAARDRARMNAVRLKHQVVVFDAADLTA